MQIIDAANVTMGIGVSVLAVRFAGLSHERSSVVGYFENMDLHTTPTRSITD